MRLTNVFFILLFICLGFNSNGSDSLSRPNTVNIYSKYFPSASRISRNIVLDDNNYRTASNYAAFRRSINFQLYKKQQTPAFEIDLQNNEIKTKAGNFKFQIINYYDSVSKKSNVPLLRNEHAGIWKKIGRAELFIGGIEVFGMTVLILLPKEITKWSDDWAKDALRNLKRAFTTTPVWDKDDWQLNYIGHPIAGSYYYNALRSQNATRFQSFLFSTAQSFIWEYIIEGVAEKPSAQDLFVTPVVGSLLGEATHMITMNMRRNGFNLFEKIFTIIFNPMYAINNGFGSRFNPVPSKNYVKN